MKPITRFFRLLKADRKDLVYLYSYSILGGIITLSLPLGIQAIMSLVLAGRLSSSWTILTVLVVIGIAGAGFFQIMQLYIAELIKRRIFAKAAMEFAFRIPKLNLQRLGRVYPPELSNRFFDTLTVQKSLSKLLIDFSSSGIQIIFGLTLLSVYHPIFIAFSLFLLVLLAVILLLTSKKGMATSIAESTEKYKVAHWLNEIASEIPTFKILDNELFHISKMEQLVQDYLKKRSQHFKVLLTQFTSIVGLKTAVTAGLLIIGAVLLINNSITIGQFVASEIIIILVLNASEKLVNSMEAVYDVLTSLEKLSAVTDRELELDTGSFQSVKDENFTIETKELQLVGMHKGEIISSPLNLKFESGKKYAIQGGPGKGKTSLLRVLSTQNLDYKGTVTFNDIPLRNCNLNQLRGNISFITLTDQLFYGTFLDNIAMGQKDISFQEVVDLCVKLKLDKYINDFHEGYHHLISNADLELSQTIRIKILVARALLRKPNVLFMEDILTELDEESETLLTNEILHHIEDAILICITNRPALIKRCDHSIKL